MNPKKSLLYRVIVGGLMVIVMLSASGCAAFFAMNAVGIVTQGVNGPAADQSREQELSRQTYPYAVADVYEALTHVVENNDRKIIDQQAETYNMRVSYPFSWLHNNWGGVMKISCASIASIDGVESTTVIVLGGARDAIFRVRAISNQILTDLGRRLQNHR